MCVNCGDVLSALASAIELLERRRAAKYWKCSHLASERVQAWSRKLNEGNWGWSRARERPDNRSLAHSSRQFALLIFYATPRLATPPRNLFFSSGLAIPIFIKKLPVHMKFLHEKVGLEHFMD
jgi:hypothetical protein